jgi:hypothetical protein
MKGCHTPSAPSTQQDVRGAVRSIAYPLPRHPMVFGVSYAFQTFHDYLELRLSALVDSDTTVGDMLNGLRLASRESG